MSFAAELRTAAGRLPASDCADAVSPLLSRRVVENWIAGRNEPPDWTQAWILTRVNRARERAERKSPPTPPTSPPPTPLIPPTSPPSPPAPPPPPAPYKHENHRPNQSRDVGPFVPFRHTDTPSATAGQKRYELA